MLTKHSFLASNSKQLNKINDKSINLVVTSPPYPMIAMWDDIFSSQNKKIKNSLMNDDGKIAFESMHRELDKIWEEISRVIIDGGIACINIGDATRTIGGKFQLFSSHSRIISKFIELGFVNLPNIIWRKPTNSPTKFMGSGMYPPGAYVTLEHEYILIFRKGNKRAFNSPDEKQKRRESTYFWEERNLWYSDIWFDLKGVSQKTKKNNMREKTAAYPFDLPYRLINMFSIKNDIILDPFLGTGTTTLAAIASSRNSIGIDIDKTFVNFAIESITNTKIFSINDYINNRIEKHLLFVEERKKKYGEGALKYTNDHHKFPVMTKQEQEGKFDFINEINLDKNNSIITVEYSQENNYTELKLF